MVSVDVEKHLYQESVKLTKKKPIDYPSVKNLVDRAVRKLIEEENNGRN